MSLRLILGKYETYSEALKILKIETLKQRRQELSNRFAEKCVKNERTINMFKKNIKKHNMKLRHCKKYKIFNARTVRMEKSAIPSMSKHLNERHIESKNILNL